MLSVSYLSAALATLAYAALAVWRVMFAKKAPVAITMAIAFSGMAFWMGSMLLGSATLNTIAKSVRDLTWLIYLFACTRAYAEEQQVRKKIVLFDIILAVMAISRCVVALWALSEIQLQMADELISSLVLGWLFSVCAVFFVHSIYSSVNTAAVSGFRLILVALGVMWAYDINLFTITLLGHSLATILAISQSIAALALAPVFAVAARRKERWKVTLSRQATTRSLLVLSIGTYFVVISATSRALTWAGSHGEMAKIALAVLLSALVAGLAFAPRTRARLKVFFVKHLFEHRYDYRSEWLRFSTTIGDQSKKALPPEERIIRSIADIPESPSGILMLVGKGDQLDVAYAWNWQNEPPIGSVLDVNPEWLRQLEYSGRILALDVVRSGEVDPLDAHIPAWLLNANNAWVAVPLVRSGSLVGIVVLGRPPYDRPLDWEDFDLLKVIGRQVATHLSDLQSQAELEQARRFEEFNRRFAFIIHDLKNVVSQLSLVSSNAAEHGANPKFQEAMANTLAGATAKMTTLLSRLSVNGSSSPMPTRVDVSKLMGEIAKSRMSQCRIELQLEEDCDILADLEQLRTALDHLIQNGIEASPKDATIHLAVALWQGTVEITIEDHGTGMSPEFIRKELFKPFASTKQAGFGIGASEAKAMIEAMGGKLEVASVQGSGTRFSVRFSKLEPLVTERGVI